jgi:5-methylcytosine-specific restriction endonuclease McrA
MKKNYRCLILNADFTPIHIRGWQTAITLIYKGKATQVEFYQNDCLRDGHGNHYPVPAVIVLKKYIRRNYGKAPFSKIGVFARDLHTCQYCGEKASTKELTLDHVVPKSKLNEKSWTNIVTACKVCNARKANKSCREASMYPRRYPVQPSYDEVFFGMYAHGDIPKEWVQYLSIFPSFKEYQNANQTSLC